MSVEDLERRVRLLATDELGVVRVAEAAGRSQMDALTMTARFGEACRPRRVVRCRAGEDGDGVGGAMGAPGTVAASGWLALGRADNTVEVIESASGAIMGGGGVDVGALPVGVHVYGPGAGRDGARLLTVTEAGDAIVHAAPCDAPDPVTGRLRVVETWEESARWKAGQHALVARAADAGALLALGGKGQGNDLKIYDVETQKMAYKAKPPPENWLGYRAPPWVSAIAYLPDESNEKLLVGTGEHRLRLYDVRADKRAVMDLDVGETTITALACSHDGAYAYVGNARGQLNSVDLRTQRLFAKYKGNGGSIRSISPHPTEPLIAVAGLDRYLRVYSLETRTCLAAAFMKQALSGCAWDVREPELAHAAAAAEAAAAKAGKKKKKKKARDEAEEEDLAGEEERLVKKKKKAKRDEEAAGTEKKKKKKKKVRRAEEDDE